MKKLIFSLIAAAGLLTTQAQVKEGSITYSVNFEGLPPEYAGMMKGSELKVYFKDKKSRSEFVNAFSSNTTISDENTTTTLVDAMGQKYFYKMNKADMEKEAKKNPEPKITYLDEKKTIAGYECKKAILETKNEKGEAQKMDVWYTDKIQSSSGSGRNQGQFKNLKGAPLEFSMNQGQFKMQMTATNVSTSPVADAKFAANTEGYTEKSYAEMKQMQKQGGGSN
jgi:GLPGLI family protein